MKWNNRLKTVLTQPGESEFSGECLEIQLTKADKSHLKIVSSVIVSGEFRHSCKNNVKRADFKTEKLHTVLNRFIENSITFEVSADDFSIIDNAQLLKTSDREFLKLNGAAILCQLQQSLLMKHLFLLLPELLEDFVYSIVEREAIMSDGDKESDEIYCSAVKSTTRIWFDDLLNEGEIKND